MRGLSSSYGFPKNARDNISRDELEGFKELAREMLGSGFRILSGVFLATFFVAYALGGLLLLPLVAMVVAVSELPGLPRAGGRLLSAATLRLPEAGPWLRAALRRMSHAALTTAVHARATLGWWLWLGR